MFRRSRRSVAVALTLAALALPAAPALAAGPEQAGPGMELWDQLGRMGDWLHSMFFYTSYIDPNGGQSADYTSHEPLNLLKLRRLEGKIHDGLGRLRKAETALTAARQGFFEKN